MGTPMSGRGGLTHVTDDGDSGGEDERLGGERAGRTRPTLSSDGAYALFWGVIALVAALLSFDGSVGAVAVLAGVAGAVGLYAAARDLLRGRPPTSLEYLWMGTPALLAAGIAALSDRLVIAGGLGVVALATLIEGYGWFGAGGDGADGGGEADADVEGDGSERPDENGRE
jgi:uncharacterized membrane protein YgdD (TMEM256/DUF423 family)